MGRPRHGESLTYECQGSDLNSYCLALMSMILPTIPPSNMNFPKGIVGGHGLWCTAAVSSSGFPYLLYDVCWSRTPGNRGTKRNWRSASRHSEKQFYWAGWLSAEGARLATGAEANVVPRCFSVAGTSSRLLCRAARYGGESYSFLLNYWEAIQQLKLPKATAASSKSAVRVEKGNILV